MNLLLWGTGRDLEEREMDFAGKKVLVVGVGISGIAAAKTAKKRFSPRINTHDLIGVAGQGVALLCDFSLFPRPPPGCKM